MGWAKFDDGYSEHPKVVAAGPLAELVDRRGIEYCARQETDGFVSEQQTKRLCADLVLDLGVDWRDLVKRLIEVGRWHEVPGGYEIHDFLDYHPTREQQEEKRRQTAEAGRQGGLKRAAKRNAKRFASESPSGTPTDQLSETEADTQANVQAKFKPVPDPVRDHDPRARDDEPSDLADRPDPPTKPLGDWSLTRTLIEWGMLRGHCKRPPDGDLKVGYRLALDLLDRSQPISAAGMGLMWAAQARVLDDYVTLRRGLGLGDEGRAHCRSLIAEVGARVLLERLVEAIDHGAGLTEEYRNPIKLLNYAMTIERNVRRGAA